MGTCHWGQFLDITEKTTLDYTRTSAINIRRKALAIDASTPTKSKSIDLFDSRCTFTSRFYPCNTTHQTIKIDFRAIGSRTNLFKFCQIPWIVFVWVMTGIVRTRHIWYMLCMHANVPSRVVQRLWRCGCFGRHFPWWKAEGKVCGNQFMWSVASPVATWSKAWS